MPVRLREFLVGPGTETSIIPAILLKEAPVATMKYLADGQRLITVGGEDLRQCQHAAQCGSRLEVRAEEVDAGRMWIAYATGTFWSTR